MLKICIIILSLSYANGQETRHSQLFKRFDVRNDQLSLVFNDTAETTTENIVDCGLICSKRKSCGGLQFDSETNTCKIVNQVPCVPSDILAAASQASTQVYFKYPDLCPPTGILIVGGDGEATSGTAEFYIPDSNIHCYLTDLPDGHHKSRHVQVDNILLGGFGNDEISYACLKWGAGTWTVCNSDGLLRGDCPGWRKDDDILVFGGYNPDVKEDLSDVRLFVDYANTGKAFDLTSRGHRHFCAIDDGDSVLIIGGSKTGCCYYKNVERYSSTGLVETLPSLNKARNSGQACAKYQVYLVAGGWDSPGYYDNSESLVEGGSAWTLHAASLPVVMGYTKAFTYNNIPYIFGGDTSTSSGYKMLADILAWDDQTKKWVKVGALKEPRCMHGVSEIPTDMATISACKPE